MTKSLGSVPMNLLPTLGREEKAMGGRDHVVSRPPNFPFNEDSNPHAMTVVRQQWERIADDLTQAGWSVDVTGYRCGAAKPVFVISAGAKDGRRFIIHAEDILTGFAELARAVQS